MPPPSLSDLYLELKDRQRRLGTPLELDDDFSRVLALSHLINNRTTAVLLQKPVSRRAALATVRELINASIEASPRSPAEAAGEIEPLATEPTLTSPIPSRRPAA
jgi:hypothetical protein